MGLSRKQIMYLYAIGAFKGKPSWSKGKSGAGDRKRAVQANAEKASRELKSRTLPRISELETLSRNLSKDFPADLKRSMSSMIGGVIHRDYSVSTHHHKVIASALSEGKIPEKQRAGVQKLLDTLPKIVPEKVRSRYESVKQTEKTPSVEVSKSTLDKSTISQARTIADEDTLEFGKSLAHISYHKGLPPGLDEYLKSGFDEVNGNLRGTEGWSNSKLADQAVESYDKFARPLPEPVKVFRGVFGDFGQEMMAQHSSGKLVGSVISEKGFTSTSLSESVAQRYSLDWEEGRGEVIFEIALPKGTPALFVDENAPFSARGSNREILLGPGSKFKVTKVSKRQRGIKVYGEYE